MNQKKPDITDLLADESFIRFCRRSSPGDIAYWNKRMQENPELSSTVEMAREQYFLLFNGLADCDLQEQSMLLRNKLNQTEIAPVVRMENHNLQKNKRQFPYWLKYAGVAAILLPAIFLSIMYFNASGNQHVKTYTTTLGERKNIQLPDGSLVNLNAGSEITISKDFGVTNRNVFLKGEAYFDVKHDKANPFIVHTEVMDVKALGTAFDVKAYQNEKVTAATLIRGLVAVTLKEKDNQVLLLEPNQKIEWQHQTPALMRGPVNKAAETVVAPADEKPKNIKLTRQGDIKEIAWKDNKLVFEDDSLEDIAKMLSRWYGIRVELQDSEISNYHFTGAFEREDIQTVLSVLSETRPFQFSVNNNSGESMTVLISK